MPTHTPPWMARQMTSGSYDICAEQGDGSTLARVSDHATAETIVRVVNAHDDLLAALEAIIAECGPHAGLDDEPGQINAIARTARAAIDKATAPAVEA